LPPSPSSHGSGCPQLHHAAATTRRRRSPTSTRTHSASWRSISQVHARYKACGKGPLLRPEGPGNFSGEGAPEDRGLPAGNLAVGAACRCTVGGHGHARRQRRPARARRRHVGSCVSAERGPQVTGDTPWQRAGRPGHWRCLRRVARCGASARQAPVPLAAGRGRAAARGLESFWPCDAGARSWWSRLCGPGGRPGPGCRAGVRPADSLLPV
jgi:hypothetical protein